MPEIPADESWVVTVFADAELGDARRTQRLIALATVLAQRSSASLPEVCGSRAMLKGVYRFVDNDAIGPAAILAVQDTTELDWTTHLAATGLGPLAHPDHRGLHVHTTLTLTPERLPLGVLAQQVWARAPDTVGTRATRKRQPITEKESHKWLTRVEAVSAARPQCPPTHFVCVGDREADVYHLFLQERPSGVDLLVRASWNRCVDHPECYLWREVEASLVVATPGVRVPRHDGSRPARRA